MNGTVIGSFTATPIPALSTQAGYFLSAGTLKAIDLTSRQVLWSFAGDGQLVSAPIVINQFVIVGSGSGNGAGLELHLTNLMMQRVGVVLDASARRVSAARH